MKSFFRKEIGQSFLVSFSFRLDERVALRGKRGNTILYFFNMKLEFIESIWTYWFHSNRTNIQW